MFPDLHCIISLESAREVDSWPVNVITTVRGKRPVASAISLDNQLE